MYAFTGTRDTVLVEQELENRDVPAELAAQQRARSEERRAERAELAAGADVGDSGDMEAVAALERPHGSNGLRPDDRVDRAQVETLRAQGHLQPGVLRIEGCARGSRLPPEPPRALPRIRDGRT